MDDFKIRCSAIMDIMATPKKNDIISAGAKTYCKKWFIEKTYGKKPTIRSQYMDKGITVEDDSIDFIGHCLQYDNLIKNEKFYSDDFMTGTPDVITDDEIIEVKSSWDCFTFPLLEEEIPSKKYYYQCQGYMHLTGVKQAKLIYTLMDTPEHIIEKEYKYNGANNHQEYLEFRNNYIYSEVTDKYRIKVFDIKYDPLAIESIQDRVRACREYLKSLEDIIPTYYEFYKSNIK